MTNEQAQKVARWWADHLRRGATFDTLTPQERRDPTNQPAVLAELLAMAARPTVPPAQADAFERRLHQLITDKEHPVTYLCVDYHPDQVLALALEQAGITGAGDVLPWKSQTLVEENTGKVLASQGYGVPAREI